MKSSPFSSSASSLGKIRFDPAAVLLPIFIGFLRAAPFVPFFAMFMGEEFGLSNQLPEPNAWALAVFSAVGFWSVRVLPRFVKDQRIFNLLLMLIGIGLWIIWMAVEPHWPVGEILRDPMSMVSGRGEFTWSFLVTLVFWLLTLKLALDEREQSSEGVRGIMMRSLAAILVAIMIAALTGGDMGEAGLSAGYIALPVALVSGVGAVGLSEMVSTREAARRRGTTVPGWSRWGRSFAGTAIIILLITFVAAIVFGPGFLALVIDTLATIWRGIATVLLWIVYALVYIIFWIISGMIWLFNLLFDTSIGPIETPEMAPQPAPEQEVAGEPNNEPWQYAGLLRLGGIVGLVVVALLVLARFARVRGGRIESNADEERSSVFSTSLLKNQLKNLFRRRGHADKPRKIDLSSDPPSVRESMLYLQVLATRLDIPRLPSETPHDFTMRLGQSWPALSAPLAEINRRYERARYGETEEDRTAVVDAWRQIWADKAELPGAAGNR